MTITIAIFEDARKRKAFDAIVQASRIFFNFPIEVTSIITDKFLKC
jgi:hypothetical protein